MHQHQLENVSGLTADCLHQIALLHDKYSNECSTQPLIISMKFAGVVPSERTDKT